MVIIKESVLLCQHMVGAYDWSIYVTQRKEGLENWITCTIEYNAKISKTGKLSCVLQKFKN